MQGWGEILLTVSIRLDWFAKTCCSSVTCASHSYHQLEHLLNEVRNRTEFQLSGCYNKVDRSKVTIGLIVKGRNCKLMRNKN